jgi:hypothetical protein
MKKFSLILAVVALFASSANAQTPAPSKAVQAVNVASDVVNTTAEAPKAEKKAKKAKKAKKTVAAPIAVAAPVAVVAPAPVSAVVPTSVKK